MTRHGERRRGERELFRDARGGMNVATAVAVLVLGAVGGALGAALVIWLLGGAA